MRIPIAGSVVAATMALVGAFVGGPATAEGVLASRRAGVHAASGTSLNWAGYARVASGFTSTSATFGVPTVLTKYNGYSASWVGIDGASDTDGYLIQTGVEADVVNHRASYYAWWEVITPTNPAPEVKFTSLAVKPGDSITALVAKGTGGRWAMTIRNNTTKRAASHVSSFAGRGTSAEWIVEDTSVNGFISAAPDWQSVTFSSILLNGVRPGLRPSEAIDIVSSPGLLGGLLGGRGTRETSTGAPNAARNGFTVTWLATGTRTQTG